MNFLAHAYLSFHHPALITGNMIADFVKGKHWLEYEAEIQEGIKLHRAIDSFTDAHPVTHAAKKYFQPSIGKYSAVFIDIVYDHFLATDTQRFTEETLSAFTQQIYRVLDERYDILPPTFQEVFGHMRQYNWLYGYRLKDGIFRSFNGITRRSRFLDVPAEVPFAVFNEYHNELKQCYDEFFPELVSHVQNILRTFAKL